MKGIIVTLLSLVFSSLAYADTQQLEVSGAYAKEVPPNSPSSAIFLTIHNPQPETRYLLSASTPAAKVTELHTHGMVDGVMKMRKLDRIEIVPKGETRLKPHGLHIMLFELEKPLTEGMTIPLTLTFDTGRSMALTVPVKKMMMHK